MSNFFQAGLFTAAFVASGLTSTSASSLTINAPSTLDFGEVVLDSTEVLTFAWSISADLISGDIASLTRSQVSITDDTFFDAGDTACTQTDGAFSCNTEISFSPRLVTVTFSAAGLTFSSTGGLGELTGRFSINAEVSITGFRSRTVEAYTTFTVAGEGINPPSVDSGPTPPAIPSTVPLPAGVPLLLTGLAGLAGLRLQKKRAFQV